MSLTKMETVTRDQFVEAVRANPDWEDRPIEGYELMCMQYLDNNVVMAQAVYYKGSRGSPKVIKTYQLREEKQE